MKSTHIFGMTEHCLVFLGMLLVGCGTNGVPGQPLEVTNAPASGPSTTDMPSELRAAYIASVQRDASELNTAQVVAVEQAKFVASDGVANGRFGYSVSISGDTAIVGAADINNLSQVVAYVFVRNGATWSEQAKLMISSPTSPWPNGYSVSISGDTAIVGVVETGGGVAYVFVRSGTTWTAQATLAPSDGVAGFGNAVAISGDTVVVGNWQDNITGSAYVFVRNGTTWIQHAKLLASDGANGDKFGYAVSVSGDTALVGAPQRDTAGLPGAEGAAYVFVRNGATWTEQRELVPSNEIYGAVFGESVSVSGDTALIGASLEYYPGAFGQGTAYVFVRNGSTWTQQQKLWASDGGASDYFGNSVSLSGDTALVGAHLQDVGTNVDQGSAYVFVRNGSVWEEKAKLVANDGVTNDQFGNSVALSGDTMLVGAWYADVNANANQGSAYAFVLRKENGDACLTATQCESGFCVDGVCCQVSACTLPDSCHTVGTCQAGTGVCSNPVAKPDLSTCNDGNACTSTDTCSAGVCIGTAPIECTPLDECHIAGVCDPASGLCSNPLAPNATVCDDHDACTQSSTCSAGACMGTDPIVCPAKLCQDAYCDPQMGCQTKPSVDGTPCNDSDGCTLVDTCQSGVCTGANKKTCPDLDGCQLGYCSSSTGQCTTILNSKDPACPLLDLGIKCIIDSDCKSAHCVDGVCCDSACDGKCVTCVLPGKAGTCSVENKNQDRRGSCSSAGSCVSTCSGIPAQPGEDPCIEATADTQCAVPQCVDATHSLNAAYCPGPNQPCAVATLEDCVDYACDDIYGTCRTQCITVRDCAPERVCSPLGKCIPPPPVSSGTDVSCAIANRSGAGGFSGTAWLTFAMLVGLRRRARRVQVCRELTTMYAVVLVGLVLMLGGCGVEPGEPVATRNNPSAIMPDELRHAFEKATQGDTSSLVGVQQTKLLANDGQTSDFFGTSVSISGDTALVGAYRVDFSSTKTDTGAAYVFVRNGTTWTQQAKLTGNEMTDVNFGQSVALSGDTALVGAVGAPRGAVYVFVRNGTTWTQQAKLVNPNSTDYFGTSVSLFNDTALVGDPHDAVSIADQGSATVFVRSGTLWNLQAELTASDAQTSNQFGKSVSISGDTALVGAGPFSGNPGSAYVFVRNGATWSDQAKLGANGGGQNTFGSSVSLSGDTALIGEPSNSAAYVFVRSGTTWNQQTKLNSAQQNDLFGTSVSLSGDMALVGAPNTHVGLSAQGSAYVFTRSGTTWNQQSQFVATDGAGIGASYDELGHSVSISGDTLLLGAWRDDIGNTSDQGSAYVVVLREANGAACVAGAQCASGFCVDGVCCQVSSCAAQDTCHSAGTCQAGTGSCSNPVKPDGSSCNDGNGCTSTDVCNAGYCFGNNAIQCTAQDGCHLAGVCDPATGLCSNPLQADGTLCNDNDVCTQNSACNAGVCVGMDPITCSADACHDPYCDPQLGCKPIPKADGTSCDNDLNLCSDNDTCQSGLCVGTPKTCPVDMCNNAYCDPQDGMCKNFPKADGTACTDYNACTMTDTCQAGSCVGADPKVCPDIDICHLGACNVSTGACQSVINFDNPQCTVVDLENGMSCEDNKQCKSGHCIEGVCCDSVCGQGCHSCVIPNARGTCTIEEFGEDRRATCGDPQSCSRTCSGVEVGPGKDPCVDANEKTKCLLPVCRDQTRAQLESYCLGKDQPCPEPEVDPCIDYACNGDVGICRDTCTSVADCGPGRVCNPSGRCVAPPPVASGEDLTCTLSHRQTGNGTGAFVLALLGALASFRRRSRRTAVVSGLVALTSTSIAMAQPAPPVAPPPAASPEPPPATPAPDPKAEATAHYEKARKLSDANDWAAAYTEFVEANRIFPTKSATSSAALCLRKLNRYDESLDLFEVLFRDYTDLPKDMKEAAQRQIVELRGLVGIVDIMNAEVGAAITVDDRYRGEYPLVAPLRVPAGSHLIRLYKDGYEPRLIRLDVRGGSLVPAEGRMLQLVKSGTLHVQEQIGQKLEVLIDGTVVGKTPWEGLVAIGQHTVTLRGDDQIGALPRTVVIETNSKADLVLLAERLDAQLRITPMPVDASISVDSIFVGRGIWDGRLRPGKHVVKVIADGYFPSEQTVTIDRGKHELVAVTLKKDPSSIAWRTPGRFGLEAVGAFGILPSFGGDVAGCSACDANLGTGGSGVVHITYETWKGLGFGGTLGYTSMRQTIADRATTLKIVGVSQPDQGLVTDTLLLRALRVGVWGAYRFGPEKWPVRARLGMGGVVGTLTNARRGRFRLGGAPGSCSETDVDCFAVGPLVEAPFVAYAYVAPEVRVGYRLSKHLEVSAGIETLIMIGLSRPKWNDAGPSSNEDHAVNASTDGYGTFESESLTGLASVAILPGIGIRYDF